MSAGLMLLTQHNSVEAMLATVTISRLYKGTKTTKVCPSTIGQNRSSWLVIALFLARAQGSRFLPSCGSTIFRCGFQNHCDCLPQASGRKKEHGIYPMEGCKKRGKLVALIISSHILLAETPSNSNLAANETRKCSLAHAHEEEERDLVRVTLSLPLVPALF